MIKLNRTKSIISKSTQISTLIELFFINRLIFSQIKVDTDKSIWTQIKTDSLRYIQLDTKVVMVVVALHESKQRDIFEAPYKSKLKV